MWIFVTVLIAWLIWYFFKLSIVSLYPLIILGTIIGAIITFYRNKHRSTNGTR